MIVAMADAKQRSGTRRGWRAALRGLVARLFGVGARLPAAHARSHAGGRDDGRAAAGAHDRASALRRARARWGVVHVHDGSEVPRTPSGAAA